MLVTHWAVESASAVAITTSFMQNLRNSASPAKATALQQALRGLIAARSPAARHPAFWAGFVLVGE